MIGVIVPAHNEEHGIAACLTSIRYAARCAGLAGEEVEIVVALDRCSDATAAITASHGVTTITLDAGCVGRARAAAASVAIARGARWLACTDADSRVPADWLSAQLRGDHDVFCGMVDVDDWNDRLPLKAAFDARHTPCDDHPHVHGANLGISVRMYQRCGGFPPLAVHEDVALVEALVAGGARIARRAHPRVLTSARRQARAPDGFAAYLLQLDLMLRAQATAIAVGCTGEGPAPA